MSAPNISYPYMPEDRHLKYVPHDHTFMQAAAQARKECAGDPLFPVGAALVKDGEVIARSGNGYSRGPGQIHVCPRVVQECPSGTGYDLCDLHNSPGHAEPMLMKAAADAGIDPTGADVYMYGHWWACEPCWKSLIDGGVRDLYVTDDAHERFSRENVFAQTLTPTVKSAYIAGALTNVEDFDGQCQLYESLGEVCEAMGVRTCIPHRDHTFNEIMEGGNAHEVFEVDVNECRHNDVVIAEVSYPSLGTGGELVAAHNCGTPVVLVSKKGAKVSRFALGNPSVVYHLQYDGVEDACRQLKNVLKQL